MISLYTLSRTSLLSLSFLLGIFCADLPSLLAQTTYHYPLNADFLEATGSGPALIPLPNDLGQIGVFADRTLPGIPSCTCPDGGVFSGYDYPVNSGFRFEVPTGFISCEYSIQFTWQYDNPGGFYEWIKILSFIYSDDSGLLMRTEFPSINGTFYYWHLDPFISIPGFCLDMLAFGTISPVDFYSDNCFYQITITRACNDSLKVYTNGTHIGSYVDVSHQYFPQAPDNQIVFFRDTFDTSCYPNAFPDEASPGFIKDLVITDQVYTPAEIANHFTTFCPVLLWVEWKEFEAQLVPDGNHLQWSLEEGKGISHFLVERSLDGEVFEAIGQLPASARSTHTEASYQFTDQTPSPGKQYYQIKAVDHNGRVWKSSIESLISETSIRVYPNPARDFLTIEISSEFVGKEAKIFSLQGQLLRQFSLEAGRNQVDISGLPEGLFLIRLGSIKTVRVMKHI